MKCTVCDNSEFTLIEGVYVCNECNNQVQSSLHEQSDQEGFSRRSLLRTSPGEKQVKAKQKRSVYDDWTTPEAYTLILRKQVTALINLGASKQLENVVLHMWCLYLQKCQIAFRTDFMAKKPVPRLGVYAPMRDRKVLYGNKLIERKMKTKKRKREKTMPKKSTSQVEENEESAFLDFAADSEVYNPSSGVDTTSEISKTDTESETENDEHLSSSEKTNLSSVARKTLETTKIHKNKHRAKQIAVHELDLSKLLSFCHLGLIYTKDHLLLLDLLRLVNERKVPYLFATELLPPSMKLKYGDTSVFRKKRAPDLWEVSSMSAKLVDFLKLPRFKHHYLVPIVIRFVTDLNLPGHIIPVIKNIIDDWKKGENEWYETKLIAGKMLSIPLYEVQAMAAIIVALKLLFVLDGKYELEHSETMMKLNILLNSDKLFVWSEWKKQMSLKEFLFMKSGISYSDFSNLEKICPELIAKYPNYKPKPNEESDRATFRAVNSKQAIETMLREILNFHDAPPHRPSSFPVNYQLHYMMSEWKKWHCFKETEEIDFSFICKDFSSQLLFYDFEMDDPDTEELIRLLLSSLYESSEIFLLNHSHSSCKKVLCTSSQYWFKNFSTKSIKSYEWLEQLPEPFVWLLQMLSRYVHVSCRHLYAEIRNIEKKLFLGMKKTFPKKVYKM
ncbi:TATA box-binding protein-associated factor RNA polymerase I subunit B [Araneus ventricosus]|uniref:TATA box-binding protein-associated factor RNA polymerase I subunit B n=1 Tax=Araneus ventricosus TaxID=182803 RepID=A0A4Y2CQP1_ARAVE|nr:TATA box-binding protein-associated factor RNA polymerase I subunit B [Araneus ventricosus]